MPLTLLDAHELGQKLDRSPETILGWARRGRIPSIKTGTGRVLFDLDRVINSIRQDQGRGLQIAQ